MAKIREKIKLQIFVHTEQVMPEIMVIISLISVFALLDSERQPMTKIMQYDTYNCYAA